MLAKIKLHYNFRYFYPSCFSRSCGSRLTAHWHKYDRVLQTRKLGLKGLLTLFFCLSFIFSGFLWAWLAISSNHVPKQPEDAAGRQKPQEQQWSVPLCNLAWRRPCLKPFCRHPSCCDPVIREDKWERIQYTLRKQWWCVHLEQFQSWSQTTLDTFFFSRNVTGN